MASPAIGSNTPRGKPLARHYTEDLEAYRNYLQGRYAYCRFTPQGLNQTIEYFNRAIALDPGDALAYAGLADAYPGRQLWGEEAIDNVR